MTWRDVTRITCSRFKILFVAVVNVILRKSQACDISTLLAAFKTLSPEFCHTGVTAPRFSEITFASFAVFSADRTQNTSAF